MRLFFFFEQPGQTPGGGARPQNSKDLGWSEILVSDIRAPESEGSLLNPILGLKKKNKPRDGGQ